jgi:hypothetical protein
VKTISGLAIKKPWGLCLNGCSDFYAFNGYSSYGIQVILVLKKSAK